MLGRQGKVKDTLLLVNRARRMSCLLVSGTSRFWQLTGMCKFVVFGSAVCWGRVGGCEGEFSVQSEPFYCASQCAKSLCGCVCDDWLHEAVRNFDCEIDQRGKAEEPEAGKCCCHELVCSMKHPNVDQATAGTAWAAISFCTLYITRSARSSVS